MSDDHAEDPADDIVCDGGAALTLDTVFSLLSNRRRRYAIYCLLDTETETIEYGALAEQVAAWEENGDPTEAQLESVRADLYHSHLPRLDAENVADFDPRSGVVRFRGQPTVEEYAEHAAHQELPDR
ncbi:DUF7344 domain-containing protein [Halostella salina]|uniref:DUF7344 domain-containing protein n=1 Tax=Halostella salina TaxID=1547897 RepID=UPI000EF80D3F|nr:hypothetical protein [Halostella salina]